MKKEESLGRWISVLYRYGRIYVDRKLKPYGIGKGQFMYLMELFEKDGLSQERIAENLNIDKGTTARALRKLEQEGYIVRERNKGDRRSNNVFLTHKAKNIEPVLFSILENWTEALAEDFTAGERRQVLALLERMADNAARFTRRERKNHVIN